MLEQLPQPSTWPVKQTDLFEVNTRRQGVAELRIQELKKKIEMPISASKPLTRFDMRFQQNVAEIDNQVQSVATNLKMDFLKTQFQRDMQKITQNLMADIIADSSTAARARPPASQRETEALPERTIKKIEERRMERLSGTQTLRSLETLIRDHRKTSNLRQTEKHESTAAATDRLGRVGKYARVSVMFSQQELLDAHRHDSRKQGEPPRPPKMQPVRGEPSPIVQKTLSYTKDLMSLHTQLLAREKTETERNLDGFRRRQRVHKGYLLSEFFDF